MIMLFLAAAAYAITARTIYRAKIKRQEKQRYFATPAEWCRWYDGDTKNPDKWKQECDEYIITEEQAKRNRKKFKIVK